MIKQVTLKHDISIARKKAHTMKSLFVEDVTSKLTYGSFYLPADVRENCRYYFAKPFLLTHEEFNNWLKSSLVYGEVVYDGYEWVIRKARWVIIQLRRNLETGTQWYVCKVWYGEKP